VTDETDSGEIPQAAVAPARRVRVSIVWIIPILAALVAVGIAVQRILKEGPTITITFKAANGVEAGKTLIKYKDVTIGQVTAVQLTEDYQRVQVTAKIAEHAAGLMVEDAKFWVVEPRISFSGVSGLSTLLSGNYIGFDAGKSDRSARAFVGLEQPPPITGVSGRKYLLKATTLGSLGVGSPVYYRQLSVGQVVAFKLADDGKSVDVTLFVQTPYDKYVTRDTRFWNASGIDVSVGANGVDVRTESLASLLAGGVAFDAPAFVSTTEPAPANTVFTLYGDQRTAMKQPDPLSHRYVLYFDESIRGLAVGAPVTFFGLQAGEVTGIGLAFDPKTVRFRPRVVITFYPERLISRLPTRQQASTNLMVEQMTAQTRLRLIRRIVEERGLRAQLRIGSLLTGALYVAFDYYPNAPKARIDWSAEPLELPVVPGTLTSLETKVDSILNKLDKLPLDAIGAELKTALATLETSLKDADILINRVDAQWVPEGTRTLQDLRRAVADAERVINDTDAAFFGQDSPAPQDLRDMLREVTRAARSIRVLVDYMERHPEMLIRGKPEENK
jgi:paraquat-inducible protein B